MTTRKRISRLTTRLSASLWMPKMARRPIRWPECTRGGVTLGTVKRICRASRYPPAVYLEDEPADEVADPEEHEDHYRDRDRDDAHHGEKARKLAVVAHSVEARAAASTVTRSGAR